MYDFEPQPDSSEIAIRADEIVEVTSTDVGDGWWEGYNERKHCGLFPEAYVERIDDVTQAAAFSTFRHPPPPSATEAPMYGNVGWPSVGPTDGPHSGSSAPPAANNTSGGSAQQPRAGAMPPPAFLPPVKSTSAPVPTRSSSIYSDDWDDDWDDESDADTLPDDNSQQHQLPVQTIPNEASGRMDGRGTIRRNLNRFSAFVKSGGEDFILGVAKVTVQDSDRISIVETEHGYEWDAFESYACTVTSPKKESKMKGLKSFIVYQLVPSTTNVQVSRRYKHFDWLHERLEEKFVLVPVAPLPDKQVTGRYEEDFIEHRMMMLQQWVNRICRHPVLSRSEVWNHFISCVDGKQWKIGKRKAEKDDLVGANFFFSLNVPDKPLPSGRIDQEIDKFSKFAQGMESSVKTLQALAVEESKRFQGPMKRRCNKISSGFKSLASAFKLDTQMFSPGLTKAVDHTATTFSQLGHMHEEQPRYDWDRFNDLLHEYRGMIASFPEMFTIHKGSLEKRREYERYGVERRLNDDEVRRVCRRADIVSYSLMAEMSHFQKERVADFTEAMCGFLGHQVTFYRQIADKLEASLKMYEGL